MNHKHTIEMPNIAHQKTEILQRKNMKICGLVLESENGKKRATIDVYGRVQWWDSVEGMMKVPK